MSGDLSEHFWSWEFTCKGSGVKGHPSHALVVADELLDVLEAIRQATGQPLRIVSGHRCVWWNKRVKGARRSQHLVGRAADLPRGVVSERVARACGAVGIGLADDGSVVHVDVRRGRRARWRY